ncbi:helix-turn-helix transcriptional regulator [Nocardia crassostreae]|uniref:helix-turn-helix transcriptional regulator n=1 Tax=Nocardia crassostreae TaxID=53428 RepID=UPI000A9097FB|nr:LuxR family transcriptional regulator [Nocardia crassostreae]
MAEAITILGEASSAATITLLLQADPVAVHRNLSQLSDMGVLDGCHFRNRDTAIRLLRGMRVDNRRRLHRRAAEVLHERGAAVTAVADHLLRSGGLRHPWMGAVLRAAAEDALALDQIGRAMDYLELSYRTTADGRDRAEIASVLAAIEWRVNPSTATRNFARLQTAVRSGAASNGALREAMRYLLWYGRVDDVRAALTALDRDRATASDDFAFLRSWVGYTYPELGGRDETTPSAGADPDKVGADPGNVHRMGTNLLTVVGRNGCESTVAMAHRILSRHRLDAATVEMLTAALEALVYADRLDVAAAWCDALLAEASARLSPTWMAIFAGLHAEIALRQGRLADASERSVQALNQVPAENLGIVIARPLACRVRALTAAGRFEEASAQMARDVPLGLFDSRLVLLYLHARGQLALATGRAPDALVDFQLCGALMQRWRLDQPGVMAWRNDVAQVYLEVGDHERARAFAQRHLDLLGDAERHGSGGVSLRLIAGTAEPPERVVLLHRAETIIRRGPDRLELARVLGDLGRTYDQLGDAHRSRTLRRSAMRLARFCGAEQLYRQLGEPRAAEPPEPPAEAVPTGVLTSAEYRVAELAARGLRNRDIAAELGITTSTVEQHLTRVYRKLKVRRRGELRFMLSIRC